MASISSNALKQPNHEKQLEDLSREDSCRKFCISINEEMLRTPDLAEKAITLSQCNKDCLVSKLFDAEIL